MEKQKHTRASQTLRSWSERVGTLIDIKSL